MLFETLASVSCVSPLPPSPPPHRLTGTGREIRWEGDQVCEPKSSSPGLLAPTSKDEGVKWGFCLDGDDPDSGCVSVWVTLFSARFSVLERGRWGLRKPKSRTPVVNNARGPCLGTPVREGWTEKDFLSIPSCLLSS